MNNNFAPSPVSTPCAKPVQPPPTAALLQRPAVPPLTRVALAFVAEHFNLYLRFGEPVQVLQLDYWRRCASFTAGAVFGRVRWQANEHGTTQWQLMVLQAGLSSERLQRLPGVRPGAHLLLQVDSELKVRAVLQQIDAMEALGIAAADVAPAYWRTLANRLAAWTAGRSAQPLVLPEYTAERHAAWLAGREVE